MTNKTKMLVAIDGSYWLYVTLFNAISQFQKKDPINAGLWIKPAEEVDQKNLPDLTNCEEFKRILKKAVMRKCETIDWHLRGNFQDQIDTVDQIDIVFALDDKTSNSFRKDMFAEYKAQRALMKRSYNVFAIQQYILNVLFKELEVEEKYNWHIIKVSGAEGDDVIATLFRKCSDDYVFKVLFASDHDFVQLEGVTQIDLFGKLVECKVGNEKVDHNEYLLSKILLGDGADNIMKVFNGVGPKKVLKLIKDRELLKQKLSEDQNAAKQFLLNKKLISFEYIPKELESRISESVNKALYKNEVINDNDIRNFMMM